MLPLSQTVNSLYLQVHEEEGAHHQQKATQVGVMVHDHEQNAKSSGRVQPVEPVTIYVLLVLHDRPALRVHPHVLVGVPWVDESGILRRVLIGRQVVDGVLIG